LAEGKFLFSQEHEVEKHFSKCFLILKATKNVPLLVLNSFSKKWKTIFQKIG